MRKKSVLLVSVGLALLVGLLGVAAMAQEGDAPPMPPTPTPAGPEVESEVGSLPPAQPGQPLAPTPTPRPPEPELKDGETGSASARQPVKPPAPPTPTPGGPAAGTGPVPLGVVAYESTLSKVNDDTLHAHSRTAYPDAKGVRADCPILWWNAGAGRWDEVCRGADFIDPWDDDGSADFDRTFYQTGWFIQVCEHRSSENNGQTWIFRYGPNYSQQIYLP
jgi:hypothetical protein